MSIIIPPAVLQWSDFFDYRLFVCFTSRKHYFLRNDSKVFWELYIQKDWLWFWSSFYLWLISYYSYLCKWFIVVVLMVCIWETQAIRALQMLPRGLAFEVMNFFFCNWDLFQHSNQIWVLISTYIWLFNSLQDHNTDFIVKFPDLDPSNRSSALPQAHLWYSTQKVINALRLFLNAGNHLAGSATYR